MMKRPKKYSQRPRKKSNPEFLIEISPHNSKKVTRTPRGNYGAFDFSSKVVNQTKNQNSNGYDKSP